jgi:hypothetical protein
MSLLMNPWQRAVCETYSGGDYRHFRKNPRWKQALEDCGDTLFHFLMVELSSAEDCHSPEEAMARLERARADIDDAIREVMRLIPRN